MIAIGALGGSGTRAIAEVLIHAGVYMGDVLNVPNDNLIFTRLFKNPEWYRKSTDKEIKKRFDLFENYMKTNKLSFCDLKEFYTASKSNPTIHSSSKFYLHLIYKSFNSRINRNYWGWKEPNTQIYMHQLLDHFENLRYIHVIRHGLDMAFSNNKSQLYNWGWKFNIHIDGQESEDELVIKQLDYWIESTKHVIKKSEEYKGRFLLIDHSKFCNDPQREVDRILDFTCLNLSINEKMKLYKIPKNTGSNNRYRNRDISVFRKDQIEFVKSLGFEI